MVPADARDLFEQSYRSRPTVVTSAPGRVNLIGEHTDYNGGQVLPIAIEQRTTIAMNALHSGNRSRVISSIEEDTGEFTVPDPGRSGRWWDYIAGFSAFATPQLPPVQIAVTSDVPAGAGLSSSAALEVATGFAYAALTGRGQSLRDIALAAWRVETQLSEFHAASWTSSHPLSRLKATRSMSSAIRCKSSKCPSRARS